MRRGLLFGAIVGVMAGCGGTEEAAKSSTETGPTTSTEVSASSSTSMSTSAASTSTTGTSSTSTSTKVSSSGTTGSSSGGAGGGATTASGGNGPVVCGDVACGPPLQATVFPPGGLAQLSGAQILVCVDEWCAWGTFPMFSLDGVSGFVNEATFVTDAVDAGADRGGFVVQAYTDDDRLLISHETVVGERFSLELTSEETVLGRVSGTLTAETIESECLTCTTYTFVNLPR